jgi:putative membrane protein
MKNLLTRWIASALALFIIAQLNVGIQLKDHGPHTVETLLLVVVVLGLANALIRPIIMFFAWPLNCMTFGLLGFAINIGLFWVVGNVVPGFHVAGPVPALIGFVAMGVISGLINFLLKDRGDKDDDRGRRRR